MVLYGKARQPVSPVKTGPIVRFARAFFPASVVPGAVVPPSYFEVLGPFWRGMDLPLVERAVRDVEGRPSLSTLGKQECYTEARRKESRSGKCYEFLSCNKISR